MQLDTFDPWADPEEVKEEYNIELLSEDQLKSNGNYDAIVLAVSHDKFKDLDIAALKKEDTIIYDVNGVLPVELVDERL